MRKWMLCAILAAGLAVSIGCDGVVKTWEDRKYVYEHVTDLDMRQIADDWDKIWLVDRQYRLTRWHVR